MYVSITPKEREEMLAAIGVSSFDELVGQVPAKFLRPDIKFHQAHNEPELMARLEKLAADNKKLLCFAGGGAYDHFVPAAVRYLASKGEFVTAYTPYQAEASQGTLQAIYEYQSSICALLGMDVSNASVYDGATALVEAVGASMRLTGRKNVVVPQALHPHYLQALKTYYAADPDFKVTVVPCPNGLMNPAAYEAALKDAACAVLAVPNFYGCIENAHDLSAKAAKAGALVVAAVNPVSLGVLAAPGEYGADFAIAEGQPLGNPLHYGGPYLGIFACKKAHMRQIPGRICGITKDADGKRAFVLTLQAREQHIRREKAASNICSNEALCALTATIHLAMLGPEGLREAAELNVERAHLAAEKLAALPGFSLRFKQPFFNEFVLKCPGPAKKLRDAALQDGILAGIPLEGELSDCLLLCCTEQRTGKDIDLLCSVLRKHANVR